MPIHIRPFRTSDAEQIARLFHDTVRTINLGDYSASQVRAWAPDDLHFRDWIASCSSRFTFVADDDGVIAGFGQLEANGHIDGFYCHAHYQRRGVGRQIYQAIEQHALSLSIRRLFAEVSITARPFFERMGFVVVTEQQVARRGEVFTNYVMEKML